jgi:TetR/AcrR family transcriptional regulator of autoinduction and epiphytic fitness
MVVAEQRPTRTYRSSRREAQARETRVRVLDAARTVFLSRGYAGTTLRGVAAEASVAVPTIEAMFGTKARLLKAAIDVAIAGDDEPVPMLGRVWADEGRRAETVEELLLIAARVLAPAQARSAGLILAVFEGSATDAALAELAAQLITQRAGTAEWLVEAISAKAPLSEGLSRAEAIDTLWMLMDPAVFDRLTRHRGWTQQRYQSWFVRSARQLLTADPPSTITPTATTRRST